MHYKGLYRIMALFLTNILVVLSFSSVLSASAEAMGRGNVNYVSNQGDLETGAYIELPLGAVQASGWLLDQLNLQKNGITGAMESYDNYGSNSGWLGGTGENWEKGPYYVRGLVALAYTLNDEALKQKAQKWIDWSLNSQKSNGFFGPSNNSDWWPRMPMLMAIRDYYEATVNLGIPDERVIPFFEKYFRYQLSTLPGNPLKDWAVARGGDNVEVVLWLYNRLFDSADSGKTDWLLDLAKLLLSQTTDWTSQFNDTTVREHVVNTTQALKTPALKYLITGDSKDKYAYENALLNISIDHGRIDGLPNADESAGNNKPTRGTELCAIVEDMWSTELAISAIGEASYGDYLEKMAYNSLPAAYAPDYLGANYFVSQNIVMATAGNHEFSTDHGDDTTFGAPCGFECCFPNNHMGWPKFVQSMWMATNDNGLAVIAYGPNKVTAKVADGKTAVFTQDTTYPFDEAIVLNYSGDTAEFPLELRIPDWCKSPVVKVNGTLQSGALAGAYLKINRTWTTGDKVEITFPMTIEASSWYSDAVAVERGPLIYSLNVGEAWVENTDPELRQMHVSARGGLLAREVYPTTQWNYGLVVDSDNPESSFEIEKREITAQPFSSDTAPVVLKAKGQVIPEWQLDGNLVGDISFGVTEYDASKVETIELVPFACTKLRITQFPKVGETDSANTYKKVVQSSRDGQKIQEIKNVIVPEAAEYQMKVNYTGAGVLALHINNQKISNLTFSGASLMLKVSNLKSLINNEYFRFHEDHVNNIRFTGNGAVKITGIEIVPVTPTKDITISNITPADGGFQVTTNVDRELSQYSIRYGTESGKYIKTASGFHGTTATVTGLDTGTYYFVVEATINGRKAVTSERSVSVTNTGLSADPEHEVIAPEPPFFDDFSNSATSDAKWSKYGTASKINVTGGKLSVGEDPDVKAVINGGENWNDYVVEAKIKLTQDKAYNNAGIMFRATEAGAGPDTFKGYYFGINRDQAMIGYSNNGWNSLKDINMPLPYGKEYTLKVILSDTKMAFYIDGSLVYCMTDARFAKGTVGVRSYQIAFTADDVSVRGLTGEDKEALNAAFGGTEFDITGRRYANTIQVRYKHIATAVSYKVLYGTESGNYTNEVYDHYYNSFTGGAAGTTAVSVPDDGKTYYVKMVALNGAVQIGSSDELVFAPYRFSKPENLSANPATSETAADGEIIGVSRVMEYRSEGQTEYSSCTGETITGLAAGNYYVRFAAENNTLASEEVLVKIPVKESVISGDVDLDKIVTVSDVVELRRIIMTGNYSEKQFAAGDLDKDKYLTVSDVVELRRLIMKGV